MTPEHRQAIGCLCALLLQENRLLGTQRYQEVRHLQQDKQAALAVLQQNPAIPLGANTDDDVALYRELAGLAEENRQALQRALRVQDRIMGIMASAARRTMETPLYGGHGQRTIRKTGLAVAVIKQA